VASRTLQMFISDLIREVRGQATPLEAQQAIRDALSVIDSKTNWEFLIARALINTEAPYLTGAVSCTAGGTALTGSGTTWSAGWKYKSIQLKSRRLPYDVSFSGATTGTLSSALSGIAGTNDIVADTYKVFQARYALPADCDPGKDLRLSAPQGGGQSGSGQIPKIEASRLQLKWDPLFVFSFPWYYTDDVYDEVNRVATIRFLPYPSQSGEFQLLYYKKLTIPTALGSNISLPDAFERLPILMAASQIMQNKQQTGWLEKKQMADNMLLDLYRRHAVSPAYEAPIEPDVVTPGPAEFGMDGVLYTFNRPY
jgi:hypothetical protein